MMEKQRPLSDVANTLGIMDRLSERCLKEAGRDGRFEARKSEYHFIESIQDAVARHDVHYDSDNNIGSSLPHLFTQWRLRPQDTPLSSAQEPITFGCLKCVFQGSRPQHVSGRPDILPFRDAEALRHVFTSLQLPTAYLQIADGSPALAKSHITYNHERLPCMYEIVVHCVAKQGDWAMALSHKPATKCSSLFWSVDKPIDSELLLEDLTLFREYAFHPMLTPCIMFAATLRAGVERRHSIKKKLGILEDAIRTINLRGPQAADRHYHKTPYPSKPLPSIESLFELLNSCRGEQASREGRYEFWRSYHEAINEGFEYAEQALTYVPQETFSKAQSELKQWNSLVWRKLESLRARDIDHITRVNNISDRLYNLIQQRDSRIQSDIARASQQDSEDMKFIAVLGSIFLPASLIASVLNVQEFQFLPGAKLFGVYIAITVPFVGIVVMLCIARPHWTRWRERRIRGRVP